jgi:hypothetical protein
MEEFRVPQHEVPVEIMLRDGKSCSGFMYVPVAGANPLPVPLLDRLNDDERYLPFSRDGVTEIVNKACILWVRLRGPVALRETSESDVSHRLCLELDRGSVVEGVVHYAMPVERSRVIDFLNVTPRFLELSDDNSLTLVNSDFVLRIHALSLDPA